MDIPVHWADQVARKIISEKGDKEKYVCASGITPSGVVHIGNFREIITVELVVRALKKLGKEVRFIYSWDDYDVFRKVPKGMPKPEVLQSYLRKAIVNVPDPFDTEESYARHFEVEVEKAIKQVGVFPEFLYQAQKYKNCEYAKGIKLALQNTSKIKVILDEFRKEPLDENWLPISGYCPECGDDRVEFSNYDGEYNIHMKCTECNKEVDVNIKEAPFIKLPWRVDWPMRWQHEQVDFEPGGKDHSTVGGSFSTGKEIVKEVYSFSAPTYSMYDFVRVKGAGGKISSSLGNVITLNEVLDVYEPAITRYLFAGTRPNTEFAISFDLDVLKIYEDFDKTERIFYDNELESNDKVRAKQKRIYELSCVNEPLKQMPFQPSLRHLTSIVQICENDLEKVKEFFSEELKTEEDVKRLELRANCAINWLSKYAPDDFKFTVQKEVSDTVSLDDKQKQALHKVSILLEGEISDEVWLHERFYEICQELEIPVGEFFKVAYNVLINKDKGPKLASFIITIGKKKVSELYKKV